MLSKFEGIPISLMLSVVTEVIVGIAYKVVFLLFHHLSLERYFHLPIRQKAKNHFPMARSYQFCLLDLLLIKI